MAVSDESVLSWEADSGAMKAKSGRILERSVGQLVSLVSVLIAAVVSMARCRGGWGGASPRECVFK